MWPYGITEGMSAAEFIDSRRGSRSQRSLLHLWELGKPVIGAINGWAMGAGSWYALYTHITIASENAVFAQPEVRHGSNTSFMWTLMAGFKNALRYGLTGDHIDAQEALRIGIVNKVVPHDQLLDECFHIVERIALVPPETVKIKPGNSHYGPGDDGPARRRFPGLPAIGVRPLYDAGGVPSAPGRDPEERGRRRLSAAPGR